jgi:hypothetical protein
MFIVINKKASIMFDMLVDEELANQFSVAHDLVRQWFKLVNKGLRRVP